MLYLLHNLELDTTIILTISLILVIIYEVINGLHDTSNAIATVIYTRSLRSKLAVIISGIFNFVGVLMGGLSVAYSIIHLFSINFLVYNTSSSSLSIIFSILISAILWNISTWYFGLPASSSHTLIGTIIGVGLINSILYKIPLSQILNISKFSKIFVSLILSPILGLLISSSIIFILRKGLNNTKKYVNIHLTPIDYEHKDKKVVPPLWIRIGLIFSSIGISFFHGANDGQKGIGLVMLALVSISPTNFSININANNYDIKKTKSAIVCFRKYYLKNTEMHKFIVDNNKIKKVSELENENKNTKINNVIYFSSFNYHGNIDNLKKFNKIKSFSKKKYQKILFNYDESEIMTIIDYTLFLLNDINSYKILNKNQRCNIRQSLIYISDIIDKLLNLDEISNADKYFLLNIKKDILHTVEYAPTWVIITVALSISIGTMIGWKRIAITICEKIGKNRMTYAQGLSAQITTAISIGIASYTGIPVSTTHIFSSAMTGVMLTDGNGIQNETIRNILISWVLTFPASIILSNIIYLIMITIVN